MINLHFQPELLAHCILVKNSNQNVKNVVHLCAVSKVFHSIINSEEFFKVLVLLAGSGHLLPFLTNGQSCFKNRYFELRGLMVSETEKSSGAMLGYALASVEGVELFSFSKEIRHFKLEKDPMSKAIVIPENIRSDFNGRTQHMPIVVRSKEYLAIHEGLDRCVYVCTLNEEKWTRYDLSGKVCQMHMDGNQLFIVEGGGRFYNLTVLDLELESNQPITLELNGACSLPFFGKDYIVYIQQTYYHLQPFALPLSSLKEPEIDLQALPWQAGQEVTGILNYFPYGNDFIEVSFDEDVKVAKINISDEGFLREVLASEITKDISETTISDIYYHDERLFITYDLPEGTKIFSYDLLTKKICEVLLIPKHTENTAFKPRFLCAAEKVYHLSMEQFEEGFRSHLTSITYSRI